MKKLLCFYLLALILGLCLPTVCAPAHAEVTPMGYTLILNENYDGAPVGMEVNVSTIKLPTPARSGYTFIGWAESASGEVKYTPGDSVTLTGDLTLYAQWSAVYAYYSLLPTAYTLSGSGYTDIPCSFNSLFLGIVTYRDEMTEQEVYANASSITFFMNAGTLTDSAGHSIPYLVDDVDHTTLGTYVDIGHPYWKVDQTFDMAVYIAPNDYANAAPGTYTGELVYDSAWYYTNNDTVSGESGSIALTLVVPERVTLDFSQAAALTIPYMALVQLRNGEGTAALFTSDEDCNEFIDLNGSGTPDIAVTEPDYETTDDFTLTLLADCDAFGDFAFDFTGPTDRYGTITFMLPSVAVPTFGTPDFTLPAAIQAIEANCFEGIAASIMDVPAGCASIGDHAFKDCKRLTQIRIPADCQLGEDVFDGCTQVYIFGIVGSSADTYCQRHNNCTFIVNTQD